MNKKIMFILIYIFCIARINSVPYTFINKTSRDIMVQVYQGVLPYCVIETINNPPGLEQITLKPGEVGTVYTQGRCGIKNVFINGLATNGVATTTFDAHGVENAQVTAEGGLNTYGQPATIAILKFNDIGITRYGNQWLLQVLSVGTPPPSNTTPPPTQPVR